MKAKIRKTCEIVDVYHVEQHGCVSNIYRESVLVNSRTWTEDELEFYEEREKDNCIDAFIEKACEWLNKELPITDLSSSNMLKITFKVFDKENKKVFIENFKKYMEGE